MNSLIDIGANLTHDSFNDDRDDVVQRAIDAGVRRFIVTGSSAQGSMDASKLAKEYPGVMYSTAGVHPHHASEYSAAVSDTLSNLLLDESVVAVGECGLDYFRNFSPPAAQRDAFTAQLELATASRKPVFLHQREAHEDFVKILESSMKNIAGGVAHCFTGTASMLEEYLTLGLYIGITGWICDERRGTHLQDIVSDIPLDRLLLETDAPYLVPRSLKPRPKTRRNEPVNLPEVLRVVSECMGHSESQIAKASTENAVQLFGLPPSPQSE